METLKIIFTMSITGSIMFLIFLLINPLTKKNFSSSWHYRMSIMILIFYIVPVGNFIRFPIKSMHNISPLEIQEFTGLDNAIRNGEIKDRHEVPNVEEQKYEDTIKDQWSTKAHMENYNLNKRNFNITSYGDAILYIWISGMIILFLLKIIPYIRFRSDILTNSLEVEDKETLEIFNLCKEELNIDSKISLRSWNHIDSPMLIGIFCPIVLISNIDEDKKTLRMIFLHELNHHKRKDIIIKAFSFIINMIHWFNPMVYILLNKMDLYCEYSIDEKVVAKMKIEDRKYYGQIILKLIDSSIIRKNTLTTSMSTNGKGLKLRLENMLFFKENSKTKYIFSLVVVVLILASGFTIACNIMPSNVMKGNDSFIVYLKEDGLYFSCLNSGKETKIQEGREFSYPVISKSGSYIAYLNKDSLYVYGIKDKKYEKIADKMNSYYTSYDWIDDKIMVYATEEPGFIMLNMSTKDKKEHLDEYYYANFRAARDDILYGKKMSKWNPEEENIVYTDGIVEIDLNKYDSKNKTFSTDIIIEDRKSTDEMIGYNPIIWDITDDGKYIYIMEKPASGSLSTDGIGIGIYDVEKREHIEFTDITTLPYKDNLSINPKANNLISLIEGGYREMILNKEVVLLDINRDKTYRTIKFMDEDLVAMTPSFTLDGERLLYSATKNLEDIWKVDFNEAYDHWENQTHNIYEYDLKTSKTKKITEGDYFDFMPISISKDEVLFSRYKGNGYHSLIKLVNGKEEVLVDNIIIDYEREGGIFGFYGHLETEKGIDIFLNEKENLND
ncbi:M56 family metallopeptidase [Tissierellaceae bacterium HCP3S3_D8]